jgi:diacylglycerol O-acyltransferase
MTDIESAQTAEDGEDRLAPGVRRLRPDDHFMILTETDATPMHVGALVILETPAESKTDVHRAIQRQVAERLAHTPLLATLRQSPDGYDSDVWVDVATCDLDHHVRRAAVDGEMDDAALHAHVAALSLRRLDLARPPFQIEVMDRLVGDRCAFYIKMHHAVADGIGFQTVLGLLSDATPPAMSRAEAGRLPSDEAWRALAEARFAREAPLTAEHAARRKQALAAIEALNADPASRRAQTPTLKLSGPTSTRRAYATFSLPLARVKALGQALDGTINDLFLAIAATAVRRYLIEIDDLPQTPIVINSARSYRRPEHGPFGNRIVALHPHLATTLSDPLERLRAIQASMAGERRRTVYDEAMLGQPERPYGARDRRARFAARTSDGAAILPGNITLSNVPGPAEARSYAGYRQLANYPTPLLGSGRFLNITSRRNGDNLDMGIMIDPTKIADIGRIAGLFLEAVDEHERLARIADR